MVTASGEMGVDISNKNTTYNIQNTYDTHDRQKTKLIIVIHPIAILQRKVQITFVQHLKRGECRRPHRRELREGSNTSVAQASRWTGHATEQNTHSTCVEEQNTHSTCVTEYNTQSTKQNKTHA